MKAAAAILALALCLAMPASASDKHGGHEVEVGKYHIELVVKDRDLSLYVRDQADNRQNLWVSIGIVTLLVPATIAGLGIGPAVLIHEGSMVLVVFNALRLLAYSGPS